LTGTSVFLKRWTAGRHSLPSHGNSRWPRPEDGGTGGGGDASSTVAAQVVAGLSSERQARCVGQQTGSNRPP